MPDWQRLYTQLGVLITDYPTTLSRNKPGPSEHLWLGRATALVEAVGNITDVASLKTNIGRLEMELMRPQASQYIQATLYQALAKAELNAPEAMAGAFIPVGAPFDAFAAVGKILHLAKTSVLIVDPYMDAKALTDFGSLVPEGVVLSLLADAKDCKASLRPAVASWLAQHGTKRPLEVRLAQARLLHDRLITVDESGVWLLTQSLNAFAARSPATIVKVDAETAALKVAAYSDLWSNAAPI